MPPFEDPTFPIVGDARAIAVHLERALECLRRGDVAGAREAAADAADVGAPPAAEAATVRTGEVLTLVDDASHFVFRGRATSLLRRGRMKRILRALAAKAETEPGTALSRDELLAVAWPGERMTPQSGALRVYTEICRLRRAGLDGALITRDDGYCLDGIVIRRVSGRAFEELGA